MRMTTTQTILVKNQPGRFLSFPDLIEIVARPPVGDADEAAAAVVSDVGPSVLETYAGMKIPVYNLRGGSTKCPSHEVGMVHINDAFSYLHYEIADVPATGTSILVEATITAAQSKVVDIVHNVRAEALFIIILDEPLGGNHLLEISAPEISASTKVRGLKWKPAAKPVLAVKLPWRNDVHVNSKGTVRPGNPGVSIKIEVLEDNTISGVSVPLKMCIFKCVRNITGTYWVDYEKGDVPPSGMRLNFDFQTSEEQDPIEVELQMDDGGDAPDPQAAADSADAAEAVAAAPVTTIVQPKVEKVVKKPPKNPRSQNRKMQTGALSQKWVFCRTFTLSDDSLGSVQTITFDPSELESGGDSIMRPFRRNIWFTGSRQLGFVTCYHFKLISNRAPQLAGRIMINTHANGSGVRWIHTFGGAPTEFVAAPVAFQGTTGYGLRTRNSPWLKCASQRAVSFRMECISFNRTDALSNFRVKLFVKPGDIIFQNPIRPRPRATTVKQPAQLLSSIAAKKVDQSDIFTIGALFKQLELATVVETEMGSPSTRDEWMDYHDLSREDADEMDANGIDWQVLKGDPGNLTNATANTSPPAGGRFLAGATRNAETDLQEIAPPAASAPECGEFDAGTDADAENIDQDDFWVCAGEVAVPTNGTAIAFPVNMQSVVDTFGNAGPSPMREKFMRYANIIPHRGGQFGPVIGTYSLIPRLPTGVTANLAHVCLPDDVNEETALRIFGLGSLLGIAGSALTSIGGPLLKGAVNSVGTLFSNVVGGLFGGNQKEETPGASSETPSMAPAIGGDIPVSRFLGMIKSFLNPSFNENPASNLLLQLLDVTSENSLTGQGTLPDTLPFKVMLKMANVLAERELFDRDTVDISATPDVLELNPTQVGIVLQELALSTDKKHHKIALQLLTLVGEKLSTTDDLHDRFVIDAKRVLKEDIPIPSADEVHRITSALLTLVPSLRRSDP